MNVRDVGSCECCGGSGGSGSGSGGNLGPCCGLSTSDTLVAQFSAPGCPIYDGVTIIMPYVGPAFRYFGRVGTEFTCSEMTAFLQCNPLTGIFTISATVGQNPLCGIGEQEMQLISFSCSPLVAVLRGNCRYFSGGTLCCDARTQPITVTITRL